MKPLLTLLFLSLFCFSFSLKGQKDELREKVEALQSIIQDVDTGKETYEQNLSFDEDRPYLVTFSVKEIDSKGRTESHEYTFNLAFLEERLIRRVSSRSEMSVELKTGREDLIFETEDGEPEGYTDEFAIRNQGVDNAREIEPLVKEIIPLAAKVWKADNQLQNNFGVILEWLATNINTVEMGDTRVSQTLEQSAEIADRFFFYYESMEDGEQEETGKYNLSLGDLDEKNIDFDIKGTEVYLSIPTDGKRDFIEYTEGEEETEYVSSIDFFFSTPGAAKLAQEALEMFIPLCREKIQQRMPDTGDQAPQLLAQAISDFNKGEVEVNQSLVGNCQVVYQRQLAEGGSEENTLFTFHLEDLATEEIEIDVEDYWVGLELETRDSKDYIQIQEDGELQNYEDKLTFFADGVENARLIMYLLPAAVEQCQRTVQGRDLAWLSEQLAQIEQQTEEYGQQLETAEGDSCKAIFTLTEFGRNTSNSVYEFNWADLSVKRMEMDIRGTEIQLDLKTNNNDKIINLYEDDEELEYTDELTFLLPNVEAAKVSMATIQAQIKTCSRK
ncbi:MAG TPA: hypothetical protein VJ953_20760 [Saprospiraceae bacterium]|nr:hypothetical protein [Saprospiraceae bacterium]